MYQFLLLLIYAHINKGPFAYKAYMHRRPQNRLTIGWFSVYLMGMGFPHPYDKNRNTSDYPVCTFYLMRNLRGKPLINIGTDFNLTKRSSVSSVIERIGKRLQKDRNFRKPIKKMNDLLIKGQEEIWPLFYFGKNQDLMEILKDISL